MINTVEMFHALRALLHGPGIELSTPVALFALAAILIWALQPRRA